MVFPFLLKEWKLPLNNVILGRGNLLINENSKGRRRNQLEIFKTRKMAEDSVKKIWITLLLVFENLKITCLQTDWIIKFEKHVLFRRVKSSIMRSLLRIVLNYLAGGH